MKAVDKFVAFLNDIFERPLKGPLLGLPKFEAPKRFYPLVSASKVTLSGKLMFWAY